MSQLSTQKCGEPFSNSGCRAFNVIPFSISYSLATSIQNGGLISAVSEHGVLLPSLSDGLGAPSIMQKQVSKAGLLDQQTLPLE